ncbi:hypothetical protein GUI43_03183 [Micromonospora noduli]|nr:hypothetical protein GUI43_03183 [Micromonospora noduli]
MTEQPGTSPTPRNMPPRRLGLSGAEDGLPRQDLGQATPVPRQRTAEESQPAVVEWWNNDRGFGKVRIVPSGDTAFIHVTVIPGTGYRCLVTGEHVQVKVATANRGLNVTALSFPADRRAGVVTQFDHLKGYGKILDDESKQNVFVHYADILGPSGVRVTLAEGERVTFDLTDTDRGPAASHVKRLDPRDALSQFVRIPQQAWQPLAELAEDDVWVFNHPDEDDEASMEVLADEPPSTATPSVPDLPVLQSYIRHTFSRLVEQDKIAYGASLDGQRAAFNTGLVTDNQEEIYGLLAEKLADDGYPWRFLGWVKESDGRIAGVFSPRPARATYWENSSVLFYDTRLPLILDWDHFVRDNISRYPRDLQNEAMALMVTRSAVDRAKERVERNYKAAVPQFHRGEVQLLLPLSLRGTGEAQLALVVRRVQNEYHGETVLPLAAALKNARLLARPDRDWLNP